ncbi:MAG: hypothetical protein GYA55_00090 [SAR324 cluster bacterium]|uniref:Uncharacterized protein n=1 Tax=SAR324 cluster bacterium TaxID=2024889 RepID=A0A7X9II00_9DELT|nr:hypothetical protein [SAR324 cluster bacterium]
MIIACYMNQKTKAPEEYRKLKKQCLAKLEQIERGLEKHVGKDKKPNFGHVGDLHFINDQLEGICKFINL